MPLKSNKIEENRNKKRMKRINLAKKQLLQKTKDDFEQLNQTKLKIKKFKLKKNHL